jgi:hypothetical protein
MGIQIVGPNRHELDCSQLAYACLCMQSWVGCEFLGVCRELLGGGPGVETQLGYKSVKFLDRPRQG